MSQKSSRQVSREVACANDQLDGYVRDFARKSRKRGPTHARNCTGGGLPPWGVIQDPTKPHIWQAGARALSRTQRMSALGSWQVCPSSGSRRLACFHCDAGACHGMNALGLAYDGTTLPLEKRPLCGARNRAGGTCGKRIVPGKRRCRLHGGLSTGPVTPEGKKRISAAQRLRWSQPGGSRAAAAHPTIKVDGSATESNGQHHQNRGPMRKSHPTRTEFEQRAKEILRREMRVRDLSYKELSFKLGLRGVRCGSRSLTNKVSGGGFSAAFFLLCLDVIGATTP